MTLNQYIKNLQDLSAQGHGDLTVIFAQDEEGNAYHKIYFSPTVTEVENLDEYYLERLDEEDVKQPNAVIIN